MGFKKANVRFLREILNWWPGQVENVSCRFWWHCNKTEQVLNQLLVCKLRNLNGTLLCIYNLYFNLWRKNQKKLWLPVQNRCSLNKSSEISRRSSGAYTATCLSLVMQECITWRLTRFGLWTYTFSFQNLEMCTHWAIVCIQESKLSIINSAVCNGSSVLCIEKSV